MIKIREGNDFTLAWGIVRDGLAEDLTLATNLVLTLKPFNKAVKIIEPEYYHIDGNNISVDLTPEHCNFLGVYNLVLTYEIADSSLKDGIRRCAIDIDLVEIVAKSAKADNVRSIAITSDVAIGLRGPQGAIAFTFIEIDENMNLTFTTNLPDSPIDFEIENNHLYLILQ